LNKKKAYGNFTGDEYLKWLGNFGPVFSKLLAPDGSLVIELGNAWVEGKPTMSLLPIEALIELKKRGNFYLCQEFIWNNTTRLPSPAQWVNVERIRVKDAFTRLWWLSNTPRPKANNRNVLVQYSESMNKLIKRNSYNAGKRPSEHHIGATSFLKNNSGAIPSNVLSFPEEPLTEYYAPSNVISLPNTISTDPYLKYCRDNDIPYHPARMPPDLAKFFIRFLTDVNDIVIDPFAGSNVTGSAAEETGRKWRAIEKQSNYAAASQSRFSISRKIQSLNEPLRSELDV
jgi:site-specific DNA-methyltransferase (cytosine-N4-specific)